MCGELPSWTQFDNRALPLCGCACGPASGLWFVSSSTVTPSASPAQAASPATAGAHRLTASGCSGGAPCADSAGQSCRVRGGALGEDVVTGEGDERCGIRCRPAPHTLAESLPLARGGDSGRVCDASAQDQENCAKKRLFSSSPGSSLRRCCERGRTDEGDRDDCDEDVIL